MATKNGRYTLEDCLCDMLDILDGVDMGDKDVDGMRAVIDNQLTQITKRREYSKTHPSKKRASNTERSDKIRAAVLAVLTDKPQTAAEVAAAVGEIDGKAICPLNVSNAVSGVDGVVVSKVIRTATKKDGLSEERPYTAYALRK